jgi:hypothetical protein
MSLFFIKIKYIKYPNINAQVISNEKNKYIGWSIAIFKLRNPFVKAKKKYPCIPVNIKVVIIKILSLKSMFFIKSPL